MCAYRLKVGKKLHFLHLWSSKQAVLGHLKRLSWSCSKALTVWESSILYYRQGDAVDFLIDIEGIDVGHSGNIVDDGHQAGFQIGSANVILG